MIQIQVRALLEKKSALNMKCPFWLIRGLMTSSITPKRLVYVDFARFKDTSVNSNMTYVSLNSFLRLFREIWTVFWKKIADLKSTGSCFETLKVDGLWNDS